MRPLLSLLFSPRGLAGASVIFILCLLNFWFYHHDVRYDLTANQNFSLSPQTQKLLGTLPQAVKVTAFYRMSSAKRQGVENRLEAYRQAGRGEFSYEVIDPELQPGLVNRFKVSLDETLVIESEGARKDILSADEQALSTAILTVTRKDKPKIYFLTGHQELPLDDTYSRGGLGVIKESLEQENYEVLPLALSVSQTKIPEDARVVVLAGPEQRLLTAERKALQKYLLQGGHVMVLLQARAESGLEAVLNTYGVQVGQNILIDPQNNLQKDYTVPLITAFTDHPITQALEGTAVFFPLARSVVINAPPEGTEATALMHTSSASWAETDLADNALIQKDSKDISGPLSIAVAVERKDTRLLVVGNARFISNRFASVLGNRDFFLNGIAWLAGAQERMDIHPRPEVDRKLVISGAHLRWAWLVATLPSAFFLLLGFGFWWKRR